MPPKKRPKSQQSDAPTRSLISLDNLRRSAGTRIRRPVLIVCEGEKTERIYLQALRSYYRLPNLEVVIHGEGGGPLKVVRRAIELDKERRRGVKRKQRDVALFEEIWCVFDREASNEPSNFPEAIKLVEEHNIRLAISNPCFEYWYLLHFVESDRSFHDATDLLNELRGPGVLAGYQKNHDVFLRIRDRTNDAHQRAEQLYVRCCQRDNERFPNPSTLVYQLVAGIVAMKPYQ